VGLRQELIQLMGHPIAGRNLILSANAVEAAFLSRWVNTQPPSEENTPTSVIPRKLSPVEEAIHQCGRCKGITERKGGFGTGDNGVMVILNAPRYISTLERKLYKKESVVLMKKMLQAIELDMSHCYITNLVKCETSDVSQTPGIMAQNCQHIIEKELEVYSPHTVLVMGELITLQKTIHNSKGINWFTVEHPITLINNPDQKKKAWDTLQHMHRELKTGLDS
jgi:uracil-DNA glycosylase